MSQEESRYGVLVIKIPLSVSINCPQNRFIFIPYPLPPPHCHRHSYHTILPPSHSPASQISPTNDQQPPTSPPIRFLHILSSHLNPCHLSVLAPNSAIPPLNFTDLLVLILYFQHILSFLHPPFGTSYLPRIHPSRSFTSHMKHIS